MWHIPQLSKHHKKQHGFTLLELLVVIVIVAILFTYSTLAIRGNSAEEHIEEESRRLERLVQLAMEEAILRGEEYGIEAFVDGYRFLKFIDGEWQPISGDPILRQRELPEDMELEMQLEETEVQINLATEVMKEGEVDLEAEIDDAQLSDDKSLKTSSIKPHIYLLSSGEITPEFSIRLYMLGVKESYLVNGKFDGELTQSESEL